MTRLGSSESLGAPTSNPTPEFANLVARIATAIRPVADFPRPGIVFRDITPLLADAALFRDVTLAMAAPFLTPGVTHVAGIESRGFIFGAPIAQQLGAGFIPLRKPGKLPGRTRRVAYALEYGADALEACEDACEASSRVLLIDDVLATGGTAVAACQLLESFGAAVVGCSFLLTLDALGGVLRLGARQTTSLLSL